MAGPVHPRYLVLHGWQNRRPENHWQWHLAESLRSRGRQVLYPQFPDPDAPALTAWADLLRAEMRQLGAGERVVVAHSLAVLLWLSVAPSLAPSERPDRVLLVAPPSRRFVAAHEEIREFGAALPDRLSPPAANTRTVLVYGDDDPYAPETAAGDYAAAADECQVVEGGGHLDLDAGYGPWPAAVQWCLGATARVSGR